MANIAAKMEDMPFELMENIKSTKLAKLTVGHGREYPIKITNLISPSNFYFKLQNLMGTMEMDISDILKDEAIKLQPLFPSGYVPNEGETIMVYVLEWSRWIRAKVDEIINHPFNSQYIVWCLDYGIAMNMKSANFLPFDEQLLAEFPKETIFHGGLAKCVPSIKDLGFFGKHRESDWCELDIKKMEDLIWNAAEIRFVPLRRYGNGQVFGDIELDKYDKDETDMAKELAKNGRAEIVDEIIPMEIQNMKSMQKKRHEGYENHNRHDIMALSKPFEDVPPVERRFDDDDQIYDRILDWNKGNKSLAKLEERKLIHDFQTTIDKLKDYYIPNVGLFRGARYRSNLSMNGSSTSSIMGSSSDLASVVEKSSNGTELSKKLFLKSLKQPNVVPKGKVAPKKMVYMPAGAERDLMEFLSIQK